MPGRDGTGPMGAGAMTGRGLGVCTGVNDPGYGAGFGRGFGRGYGRGFGRGFGCGFGRGFGRGFAFVDNTAKTKKELLEAQKNELKSRMDAIEKQLEALS